MLNKRGRPSYEIIGDTTSGSTPTAVERAAGGDACIALRASAPPYTLGGGGKTDWFSYQHVKYNCTPYQEARVVADIVDSGDGVLGVDFALDDVTWTAVSYDGDAQITLGAAGTIAGSWMTLKDICVGDCYFRWWTVSGDAQVGNVYLQFRGDGATRRTSGAGGGSGGGGLGGGGGDGGIGGGGGTGGGTGTWYVAATGSSSNAGTAVSPWDLQTALNGGSAGQIAAGDLVLVDGTAPYTGSFSTGTALVGSNPSGPRNSLGKIHFKPNNANSWTIDGTIVIDNGHDVWFWDMEVHNTDVSSANIIGIDCHAARTGFIRCVAADHSGDGFGNWSEAPDSFLELTVSYNNGFTGTDPGTSFGHGYYYQNMSGSKQLRRTVAFNNFGYNYHHYSETGFLNFVAQKDNFAWGAGRSHITGFDYQIGGHVPLTGFVSDGDWNSVPIASMAGDDSTGFRFGFGVPGGAFANHDVVVSNIDCDGKLLLTGWDGASIASLQVAGRISCGDSQGIEVDFDGSTPNYTHWTVNNITYSQPSGHGFDPFLVGTASTSNTYDFAGWKAASGQDSSSTFTIEDNQGTRVSVSVSDIDPNCALVRIKNPTGLSTVAVDLSSFLTAGNSYLVSNTLHPHGTPVLSGTYSSGTLAFPMTGQSIPSMLGGPLRSTTPMDPQPYAGSFWVQKS